MSWIEGLIVALILFFFFIILVRSSIMLNNKNLNQRDKLASCCQLYQVRSNGREYKKNLEIAEIW